MRTVQTLRDAEIIINRLLDDAAQLRKDFNKLDIGKNGEEKEISQKFFDIANEVEFMRELNLVIHRLHHKFKRVVFEGESRWYDYLGRTPAQWYTQFAVIPDSNNSSLFLRDAANRPIWEIVTRVGGVNVSNWVSYMNFMPPRTNPLDPAGRFNLGGSDFRWDQIYARRIDADRPALDQPQVIARAAGTNPVSLYSYDSVICSVLFGADATGNTFTARASSAFLVMKENDLLIFGNKGLTSGSVFSPTLLWRFSDIDIVPSGDKNIGSASFRIATYFGKYMELDTPISDVNTQFVVKTGGVNGISLVSFDAATCGVSFGSVYTGGNWIAQSSTVVLLQKTTNSLEIYMNNGLGVGGSFSPTLIWQFDGAGNFIPALGQSIGNTSFRVGTLYASSLNLSGGFTTSSVINATGYQISGTTVIDSSRAINTQGANITGRDIGATNDVLVSSKLRLAGTQSTTGVGAAVINGKFPVYDFNGNFLGWAYTFNG